MRFSCTAQRRHKRQSCIWDMGTRPLGAVRMQVNHLVLSLSLTERNHILSRDLCELLKEAVVNGARSRIRATVNCKDVRSFLRERRNEQRMACGDQRMRCLPIGFPTLFSERTKVSRQFLNDLKTHELYLHPFIPLMKQGRLTRYSGTKMRVAGFFNPIRLSEIFQPAHRGKSISTISEFSRSRSNTICFPSGVTSKVRMVEGLFRCVSGRVCFVTRSSSQKSWERR